MAICNVDVKLWSNNQYAGCSENTGQVIVPVAFVMCGELLAGWLLQLPYPYAFDAERGRQAFVPTADLSPGHLETVASAGSDERRQPLRSCLSPSPYREMVNVLNGYQPSSARPLIPNRTMGVVTSVQTTAMDKV